MRIWYGIAMITVAAIVGVEVHRFSAPVHDYAAIDDMIRRHESSRPLSVICTIDITPEDQTGLPRAEQWGYNSVPSHFAWFSKHKDDHCYAEDSEAFTRAIERLYKLWGEGI